MSYGKCPECGASGKSREKGLDGNDECEGGHTYKSDTAVMLKYEGVTDGDIQQLKDEKASVVRKLVTLEDVIAKDASLDSSWPDRAEVMKQRIIVIDETLSGIENEAA